MKYIIMDEKNGDLFNREYETEKEAVEQAEKEWNSLSEHDKKQRTAYYVLESINPDEEAENHFDGNVVKVFK